MTSSLKSISPVLSELTVEIPQDEVAAAVDSAYAELGRTAKIRGFRKGKVPRTVLRRMFGPSVLMEVRNDLVATKLREGFASHSIVPLSRPDMDLGDLVENAPYAFTATFEIRPKLEKIDYSDIDLETHTAATTDEDVDKEIARLRSAAAEVTDLEAPRAAAPGDLAEITIKHWVDGEWQAPSHPDQNVIIGETPIEQEVEAAIVGMQPEEERVVDLGSDKEIDADRTRYLIRLNAVKQRTLPDLDDEFAKDLGDYETLDDLRKTINSRLEEQRAQVEQRRLQDALFDRLREKNPMELPPTLVEQQILAFRMRVQSSLAMLGDKGIGEEKEQAMFDRAEKAAKEMVHQHLLVLECARIEQIDVSDDEIEAEMTTIAQENGLPLPMVKAEYAKEGRQEGLVHQLLEKKIFDFILPQVKITEVEPPSEAADEAGS
ncbi:MAG: trigger factor [Myxococcota bacterium]|nr:trigger factor [Myxococcota bacterium]